MKKRRFWFILVAVVAVLAVGFYFVTNGNSDKVSYRFDKVSHGDVVVSISATGTLNADTTVQVGSQVSGRIARIYVDFNSSVKKGQLLAQLDPTFLQAALNQAKAGVVRAQATLNQAERDFNRTRDLFTKSLVSQADMDAAVTNHESAKAGFLQAEASLEGADVNLRYATITSPISGVVISRAVDVGQTVAASLSAPTLFTIANDLKKMQVQASVDEADIGNVKSGQRVTFRVDSYPEDQFNGMVSQVRLAPVTVQNVVNYTVIIAVANPDLKLMPGMTATVSIEVDKRRDVLRVPIQAIRFTPPEEAMEGSQSDNKDERSDSSSKDERTSMMRDRSSQDPFTVQRRGMRRERRAQDSSQAEHQQSGPQRLPRARIWVLDGAKLKAITVARGLMNTQFVEVIGGELKAGDEIIVGAIGGQTPSGSVGQNNPFQPRMPGGGGGGRGRGF